MLRLAPSSGPDFTVTFDFTNTIASRKLGSVLRMAWEKQPLLSAAFVMLNIHPSISPSLPTTAQSSVLWVSGLSISDVGSQSGNKTNIKKKNLSRLYIQAQGPALSSASL